MRPNGRREFKIPKEIEKIANLDKKKFIKKSKKKLGSKKAAEKDYVAYLMDSLPEAVEWCVKYSKIQEAKETKLKIFEIFKDVKLIEILSKGKNIKFTRERFEVLPVMILEMLRTEMVITKKSIDQLAAEEEWVLPLTDLSKKILEKKIEKLTDKGFSADLAFDLLSVIPTNRLTADRQGRWRLKSLIITLYQSSADEEKIKTEEFDFNKLIKFFVKPEYMKGFITALLLEYNSLKGSMDMNENQCRVFNLITRWCFDKLESFEYDDEVNDVLTSYIEARKNDDANGKDANRRYSVYLAAYDKENEKFVYPKLHKVVEYIIKNDATAEKYLQ